MPVVMKITLLLLLFGSCWAQELNTMSTPKWPSPSSISNISEPLNLNSVTSNQIVARVPEKNDTTRHQISIPSSAPYVANEVSSPETSTAASGGLPVLEPTISQEISTKKSSMLQEISTATSNLTVPAMNIQGLRTMTGGTMATNSLETFSGTSGPRVTMATVSLEASNETSGFPITMSTSSQETSDEASGPTVTMATGSLEASSGTSGHPVTMTSSSLETSDETSAPPISMATSTLETSKGISGLPVTMATSSLKTPKGTSGSPISTVKISMSNPETSTNTASRPSPNSVQGTNNTLLAAVFVALLVVIVLLVLLLLWRLRQKQRTGALTLSRGGKHNGVVDAWAGPARVSDEEAVVTTVGVSGGDKGSGVPEGEGSGRRPTLTTFFGRRKSRQGSLALEELKVGSDPSIKGEEEPLVGSEDGAMEAPASNGPEAGNVEIL